MARETSRDREDLGGPSAQLLRLLLDRIDQDNYPSVTMLDIVEELLTPDDVTTYAGVLLSKIEGDIYPSTSLIRRVAALG